MMTTGEQLISLTTAVEGSTALEYLTSIGVAIPIDTFEVTVTPQTLIVEVTVTPQTLIVEIKE